MSTTAVTYHQRRDVYYKILVTFQKQLQELRRNNQLKILPSREQLSKQQPKIQAQKYIRILVETQFDSNLELAITAILRHSPTNVINEITYQLRDKCIEAKECNKFKRVYS